MYYRITAYNKDINISVIMDSTEKFKSLEEFERYMESKGFKIIESGTTHPLLVVNLKPPKNYPDNVILRACQYGKPEETTVTKDGVTYRAIKVDKKIYVPYN